MLPFNTGFNLLNPNGALFPQQMLLPGVNGMPQRVMVSTPSTQLAAAIAHNQAAQAQAQAVHNAHAVAVANAQAQAHAVAVAAQAAASRPSPMLVPPGMGNDSAASQSPSGSGSQWTEHTASDGRIYYYNKSTKQSSWTKPDELKSVQERSTPTSTWKEYRTPEGKAYYYNSETKETTWTAPEGFSSNAATPSKAPSVPAPDVKVEVKEEMSDLDKAMAATLKGIDLEKKNEKPISDVPMVDEEQELKKRQADLFRELLRDKYDQGKITSTCTWEQAMKHIQPDARFRILSKVSEKKQLFNAWKVQRQKDERDEKRLAIKQAKECLEKWLQDHPKMKTQIRYIKACDVFEKESIWKAVTDSDRKEIFKDVQAFVHKREAEQQEKTRKRNLEALTDILEGMQQITYRTTWAQAQRLLIENPDFADDVTLQSMDKEDALVVFEDYIRAAEKEHEKEKEAEDRRLKRQERKVREAFQCFLEELHQKGQLHSMALWSSLYPVISADRRFDAMLTQSGSTPLDLFKFYVEELKEQYVLHRRIIKDILTDAGKTVQVKTAFDELVEWVQADERGKKVDAGNMKLCYNSLIEKAESKEKEIEREEQRKRKRQEGEFRNLLRAIVPPVEPTTEWASIRAKIEGEEAFKVIETEELREKYFSDYITQAGDACSHHHTSKKKKKEKKKKGKKSDAESDSEDDRGKKKRKYKGDESSDEERKRKKKSRRRSRSRSGSRSDEDRRRRRDSGSDH